MNTDPLDEILASYARTEVPPLAARTEAIWKEIELRKQKRSWLSGLAMLDWKELFGEPRLAFAALALAVGVGMLPGMISYPKHESEAQLARQSLHFESFTGQTGNVFSEIRHTAKP